MGLFDFLSPKRDDDDDLDEELDPLRSLVREREAKRAKAEQEEALREQMRRMASGEPIKTVEELIIEEDDGVDLDSPDFVDDSARELAEQEFERRNNPGRKKLPKRKRIVKTKWDYRS